MMTYRDRREAKAERLRGWADKREVKAEAAAEAAGQMADAIPFGQPILVGHYSEGRDRRYRDRMGRKMDQAVENSRKADSMRSKADNIEAAADAAVYDDDPDAVERLEARIADLELERDRVKAYNASCRKGSPVPSLLDERQRDGLAVAERFQSAYQERRKHQMPPYYLSNLGGRITKDRQRLERLRQSHVQD